MEREANTILLSHKPLEEYMNMLMPLIFPSFLFYFIFL